MGTDLSVKEFTQILREETDKLAHANGWNLNTPAERGYALQLWFANLFCLADQGIDTDPEDGMLYSHDLKADLVLEDSNRHYLAIVQCKFLSLSKMPDVEESEVNDFFNRHALFMDRQWVKEHGSKEAYELLGEYHDKVQSGHEIDYYFVSTGKASDRIKAVADRCAESYRSQKLKIKCHLLDFYGIKDFYVKSHSLEETIPHEVSLKLSEERWFEKANPYETIITVVKGNTLRNLYLKHKESLFAWNIRGYLGSRGINNKIIETAETKPDSFFYFNNGVSAICTGYSVRGNELTAQNFQIINGAQTVGALAKADPNQDVEVLFRLTRAASVKTEKGMNVEIIRYNNSQNIIKTSDFHSNDQIQMWLEQAFRAKTPQGPIPKINYLRRRGPLKGIGRPLKLEELAKVRYAFLNEPTLVHSSPKDLWTPTSEHGAYEKSFGVAGDVPDMWSDKEFARCLLALAFYFKIQEELAKEVDNIKLMKRLRFHALSLAGLFTEQRASSLETIMSSEEEFLRLWKPFWEEVRRVLIDAQETIQEQKITFHAYIRSDERWNNMRTRFVRYLGVPKSQL